MSYFDDGTRSLFDLPASEQEDARDDAYRAAHPRCAACGTETCDAPLTCACGPETIRIDRFDVACSEKCRAELVSQ